MKRSDVRVFQIYYRDEQIQALDPLFEPVSNAGVIDPFLEFGVFKRLHEQNAAKDARLWGAMSWKFGQKTGMSGAQLMDVVDANPGYDLYYCNPNMEIEALFQNMWMHGQTTHPGFIELAQDVLTRAGIDPAVCTRHLPGRAFAFANFMLGSPEFWADYVAFVDGIMLPALEDPELRERLLSSKADPKSFHFGACYVPFVVERLFGLFIDSEAGRKLKIFKYEIPGAEAKMSPHLRLLREMRENACIARSTWLAGCWLGYRSLFFQNTRGQAWAREHLPQITPPTIEFGEFRPEQA